jgi:hypothetical protein
MKLYNLQQWHDFCHVWNKCTDPLLTHLNVGLSTWARPDPCDQISPRPFSTRLKLLARLHKAVEACGPDNMDSKMVSMNCRWRIHDLRHYIRIIYGLVQVCLVANDCIMICQYGKMMENVYRYTFNLTFSHRFFLRQWCHRTSKQRACQRTRRDPGHLLLLQMRWHLGQTLEASRINQYNMFLSRNFEKLWSVDLNSKIRYC